LKDRQGPGTAVTDGCVRIGAIPPVLRADRERIIGAVVVLNRQAELLEIVDALRPAGGLASGLDCGQQECDQDCNDGDHHQQLDKRERSASLHDEPRIGFWDSRNEEEASLGLSFHKMTPIVLENKKEKWRFSNFSGQEIRGTRKNRRDQEIK
jgi:hypothetical protein